MNALLPKISVVSPSYNQGNFLAEAIRSVQNQDYPHFEHIVVDGGSAYESVEVLKAYPHVRWVSEPDEGQSDALNKGFEMATGEIIGWLNVDDAYLPGCFREVAEFMTSKPDIDVAYGNFRWVDADGKILQWRREIDFDRFILKYLHVLCIPTTSTFFRASSFDFNNFIDKSYNYSMDYELFVRLDALGYKFGRIDRFLADFRWHDESKSSAAADKQHDEQIEALLRHDRLFKTLPRPLQPTAIQLLRTLARAKRYVKRGVRGDYFRQWRRTGYSLP